MLFGGSMSKLLFEYYCILVERYVLYGRMRDMMFY